MVALIVLSFIAASSIILISAQRRAREQSQREADRVVGTLLKGDDFSDMKQETERREGSAEKLAGAIKRSSFFQFQREGRELQSWVDRQLQLAGRPKGWSASDAIARVVLLWLVGGGFLVLVYLGIGIPPLLVLAAMVLLFLYPFLKLRQMVKQRRERAQMELPVFMNSIIMNLSGGVTTIDDAIQRTVSPTIEPPGRKMVLVDEIGRAYFEYRHTGRDREEALRDAAERIDSPSVSAFIDSLIQGLRTGTDIQQMLKSQSAQVQEIFRQDMRAYIGKKESSFMISLVMILAGIMILAVGSLGMQLGGFLGGV